MESGNDSSSSTSSVERESARLDISQLATLKGDTAKIKEKITVTKEKNAVTVSDASYMPWGCKPFCVAAVSQKLLPYNIIVL